MASIARAAGADRPRGRLRDPAAVARSRRGRRRRRDAAPAAARGAPTVATAAAATVAGFLVLAALAGADGARLRPAARRRHRPRARARAGRSATAALVARRRGAPAAPAALRGAGDLLAPAGRPRGRPARGARRARRRRRRGRARRRAAARRVLAASARPGRVLAVAAALAVARLGARHADPRRVRHPRSSSRRTSRALRDLAGAAASRPASGGQLDVVVEADDVTDPEVVDLDDAATSASCSSASATATRRGCGEAELCPAFSLPDLFQTRAADRKQQIDALLDAVPPYFSQSVITADRTTATLAFGIRLMPLERQQEVIEPCATASTRPRACAPSSPGCRCSPPRPTTASRRTGGGCCTLVAGLLAVVRSCCCSRSAPAPRARPARPDRAGDRLVGARALRAADPAQPDVGDARRAGHRDLDRVQRAAVRALPPGARAPATSRRRRSTRTYRSTGAAVLASGVTAIAGFAVLVVSDIRMLRDFGFVTVVDLTVSLLGVLRRAARRARAGRARGAPRLAPAGSRARPAARAAAATGDGPLDGPTTEPPPRPRRARAAPPPARPPGASRYTWFVGVVGVPRARARDDQRCRTTRAPARRPGRRAKLAAVRRAAAPTRLDGDANVGDEDAEGRRRARPCCECAAPGSSTSASWPSTARSCSPLPDRRAARCAASSTSSSGCAPAPATCAFAAVGIRGDRDDLRGRAPAGASRSARTATARWPTVYGVAGCPQITFARDGRHGAWRRRARELDATTALAAAAWSGCAVSATEPERRAGSPPTLRGRVPRAAAVVGCAVEARPGRSAARACASACGCSPTASAARRRSQLRRDPSRTPTASSTATSASTPTTSRTPVEAAVVDRLLHGGFRSRGLLDDALLLAVVETGVPVWALDDASARRARSACARRAEASARATASSRPTLRAGPARRGRRARAGRRAVRPIPRPATRRARSTDARCGCSRSQVAGRAGDPRRGGAVACAEALDSRRERGVPLRRRWSPPGRARRRSRTSASSTSTRRPRARDAARADRRLERQLSDALVTAFPHDGARRPRSPRAGRPAAARPRRARGPARRARAPSSREARTRARASAAPSARRNRVLLERMLLEPKPLQVRPPAPRRRRQGGCGAYQVRPRLGLIGMLMGWWQVKLSSGCPVSHLTS